MHRLFTVILPGFPLTMSENEGPPAAKKWKCIFPIPNGNLGIYTISGETSVGVRFRQLHVHLSRSFSKHLGFSLPFLLLESSFLEMKGNQKMRSFQISGSFSKLRNGRSFSILFYIYVHLGTGETIEKPREFLAKKKKNRTRLHHPAMIARQGGVQGSNLPSSDGSWLSKNVGCSWVVSHEFLKS